ncbi:MAG: ATP-binding cassette domain-containing protein [Nitrospirae bacterium]|nr:ATP-binding cassette domain-containing protein [Nitrospirota bacterium]
MDIDIKLDSELDNIFEVRNLHYSFLGRYPALCDVSFDVKRGERVVVLGANGSGKSSLMNLLDGLVFPQKGEIRFMGREISEQNLKDENFNRFFRNKVGFVFQNSDVQLFSSTVWDEIAFGPLHLELPHDEVKARVEDISGLLGIKKLWERAPYQLSGGEKKKVAIASTVVVNPDVLLLDEPTNGLDPRSQAELVDFLQELYQAGKTIIISTHDLNIAKMISDRAIVLNESHTVEAEGATRDILENTELLLKANLIHEHIHCHDGEIHRHPHGHVGEHDHEHGRGHAHKHSHKH